MTHHDHSLEISGLRSYFTGALSRCLIAVIPGLFSAQAFAAGIDQIDTHGSSETAGIILYLSPDSDGGETANPRIVQFTTKPDFSTPMTSRTLTVAASGADFISIEAAVNAALPGDEVMVSPGTYIGSCAIERYT